MSVTPTGGGPESNERRNRRIQATREEIKAAAWTQIARQGASSLSLRAIAASIGLTAPALYRYFPGKGDLVTALVVEAYESLADSLDLALARLPGAQPDWRQGLRELGRAYRDWARQRPAAFYIIFGDPIPGYQAPATEVMAPAARTLQGLIVVLGAAHQAGDLCLPLEPPASPVLAVSLKAWSDAVHRTHPDILYLAFMIASRVQGLMLVELGRQLPPFIDDCTGLYERETERMILEIAGNH